MYHCPTASTPDYNANYAGYSRSDYVAVHGAAREVSNSMDTPAGATFSMNSHLTFADIEDGTQFTLMAGERSMTRDQRYGAIWMRAINRTGHGLEGTAVAGVCHHDVPMNDSSQGDGFLSWHPGGVGFAMMDGATYFLSEQIDGTTYESLAQIHDGRQLTESDLILAAQ